VVHATSVPRRGSSSSEMFAPLHRGQRGWVGHVVAEQSSQRLPMSCGFSAGHVDTSGASAFVVMVRPPLSDADAAALAAVEHEDHVRRKCHSLQ